VSEENQEAQETQETSWKDSLPEDLREHSVLAPIQDVDNLAKAYVNASTMIGKDKIAIPGKHSSPEDWDDVYNRLGRPESGEAYDLTAGENTDADMMGWFRNTAHEAGLNNSQAQKLVNAYNDLLVQNIEEQPDLEKIRADVQADLQKEYGNAYEDRLTLAKSISSEFGTDDLTEIKLADGTLLGDNPMFIKAMVAAGEYIRDRISEDRFEGMDKVDTSLTPDEARAKLTEIEAPDGPLWDRRHPAHEEYVRNRNKLYEEIYPAE